MIYDCRLMIEENPWGLNIGDWALGIRYWGLGGGVLEWWSIG